MLRPIRSLRLTGLLCGLFAFVSLFSFMRPLPAAAIGERTLRIGDHRFQVEIADSPEERRRGLMNRQSLPPRHGMFFVFEQERQVAFWMKDTPLPLSVAYIDSDGIILEIHDLQPYSLRSVASAMPIRYALELNQGEFAELGIGVGDRVLLPPSVTR